MSILNLQKLPAEPEQQASDVYFSMAGGGDSHQQICDEWSSRFKNLGDSLQELAATTEEEFLSIGAKLQDFTIRASRIADMSSTVSCEIAGEEINQAIDGLNGLLERMHTYLTEAEGEIEKGAETLGSIKGLLEGINEPLTGFKKIIKALHMLGISTKIESSRLGTDDSGFKTLADDVKKLSVLIEDKSAVIMEQKDSLSRVISETLSKAAFVKTGQREHTRNILNETRSELESLSAAHDSCAHSALTISERSAELSSNMGEIVTSLQFHDITRQQLEHVKEAFDDQMEKLAQLKDEEPAFRDRAMDIRDVCELQSYQLAHAREEFRTAVESIIENLKGISSNIADMCRETREMAGAANKTGGSFLTEMQKGLSIVTDNLSRNAEEYQDLTATMTSVGETVGDISRFVNDIEDIGTEIELIALNAQIKAAHTGDDGAALGVLAEAIQRLSVEAMQLTNSVSGALRGITSVTDMLITESDSETSILNMEAGNMLKDLEGLMRSFRDVNDSLTAMLLDIDQCVESLSNEIKVVIGGITVHERSSTVVSDVADAVDVIVAKARELAPVAEAGKDRAELISLAKRYTMHSERKVHEAFTKSKGKGGLTGHTLPEPGGLKKAVGAETELDDNIELF